MLAEPRALAVRAVFSELGIFGPDIGERCGECAVGDYREHSSRNDSAGSAAEEICINHAGRHSIGYVAELCARRREVSAISHHRVNGKIVVHTRWGCCIVPNHGQIADLRNGISITPLIHYRSDTLASEVTCRAFIGTRRAVGAALANWKASMVAVWNIADEPTPPTFRTWAFTETDRTAAAASNNVLFTIFIFLLISYLTPRFQRRVDQGWS